MRETPTGSFFKFFFGFAVFIGMSIGLTIAVNTYTVTRDASQHAAAALAGMVGE